MNKTVFLLLIILSVACQPRSGQHDHSPRTDGADRDNPNKALFYQALDIHDEAMPWMDEMESLKRNFKEQLARNSDLPAEKRQEIESALAELETAGKGMWDWMHEFDELPDSVAAEEAQAYYERELERIRKVKQDMLTALEKARALQQ